jgi:hypothetical protein
MDVITHNELSVASSRHKAQSSHLRHPRARSAEGAGFRPPLPGFLPAHAHGYRESKIRISMPPLPVSSHRVQARRSRYASSNWRELPLGEFRPEPLIESPVELPPEHGRPEEARDRKAPGRAKGSACGCATYGSGDLEQGDE